MGNWSSGSRLQSQEFLTTNAAWPIPTGVTGFFFLLVGGGASGGGGAVDHPGGGGGGAMVKVGFFTVTPGATALNVTIGAGGASVAANTNGNDGIASTITDGTLVVKAYQGKHGAKGGSGLAGVGGIGGGCQRNNTVLEIGGGSFGGAFGGNGGLGGADPYPDDNNGSQACSGFGQSGVSGGANNGGGGGGGSFGAGADGAVGAGNNALANSGAGGSGGGNDGSGGISGAGGSGRCILTWIG